MGRSGDIAGKVHRAYAWVGERQVHYRRSGPDGARSPLLLLHAPQGAVTALEGLMAEMGRERSVIALDLPGTGMSDPLEGPADAAAQASVLLEIVAALGLGMVDVAGLAAGGAVAVEMAHQQPDVVRKIVLLAAPPPEGLLSQPLLALNLPERDTEQTAAAIRSFLDS